MIFFLLCNNLFIYQVLCTLIYRRRSLYSFLLTGYFEDIRVSMAGADVLPMSMMNCNNHGDMGWLPHVLVPQQNGIIIRFFLSIDISHFRHALDAEIAPVQFKEDEVTNLLYKL